MSGDEESGVSTFGSLFTPATGVERRRLKPSEAGASASTLLPRYPQPRRRPHRVLRPLVRELRLRQLGRRLLVLPQVLRPLQVELVLPRPAAVRVLGRL